MKYAKLSMFLFLGASIAGAATITVGPHGQYSTVCTGIYAANDGDTVLIDANHGIPYIMPEAPNETDGRVDCRVNQNYLTIRGVNGRAILDAGPNAFADGTYVQKGILVLNGHDITIDNLELRNAGALVNPNNSDASGIRIQNGTNAAPSGGNITVTRCYIHNNDQGILTGNTGPGIGSYFSPKPFFLFEYDDFYDNGDGSGSTHNIYIGFDGFRTTTFTLRNSKSRDAFIGHDVKTRAAYNYIFNNEITDTKGATSYLLEFCLGGTTYVEGNLLYKSVTTNPDANEQPIDYRDIYDNTSVDPLYGPPNEDLHFLRNVVIDANPSPSNAFVNLSCDATSTADCPPPLNGPVLTTPAVVESNLFIGQAANPTNQPDAVTRFNLVLPYSKLAALAFIPH